MTIPEAKTRPTLANVAEFINAIEDQTRRQDCHALVALMERVSGCRAQMWGSAIVGFDQYHYTYASGHSGDACVIGFSPRKGDLSIYILPGYESAEVNTMLAKLGKHKLGKVCLYVRRLADIDMAVLEQLVAYSYGQTKRQHPSSRSG